MQDDSNLIFLCRSLQNLNLTHLVLPAQLTRLCFQVPAPSDEDFLHSNTLEDLLSSAAAAAAAETTDPSEPAFDQSETPVELQEHQYCLPASDPDARTVQIVKDDKRRKTVIEPSFSAYNQIARFDLYLHFLTCCIFSFR